MLLCLKLQADKEIFRCLSSSFYHAGTYLFLLIIVRSDMAVLQALPFFRRIKCVNLYVKFLAYTFSLLLFFIAVSPVAALHDEEKEISCCADKCSSETNEANTSSSEAEDCGFCNPFFSCACYSGVILQEVAHLTAVVHFFYQPRKAVYKELIPFQIQSAFWQPPKIVA